MQSFSAIICMNETESKYYAYQQNGLLVSRVDFKAQVEQYGQPIAVSSNGLNFIFKQSERYLQSLQGAGGIKDDKEFIRRYMTASIFNLSVFGLCHIKDIDILAGLKDAFENPELNNTGDDYRAFKRKNMWLFTKNF